MSEKGREAPSEPGIKRHIFTTRSRLDCGSPARPGPQFTNLEPADGTDSSERADFKHASIHQGAEHDLDRDGHQEREDRAEQGSRGDPPYGPAWKTAHAHTVG